MHCECGSDRAYVDWWYNHREKKQETFVRCPNCSKLGPSSDTEAEAVMIWMADGANNDL